MRTDSAVLPPARIAVSACLLGERVRYDGDHSRSAFVVERLGRCFELIPDCPEVGIGLGTPRPKIRLAEDGRSEIRLLDAEGGDLTARMSGYAAAAACRFAEQRVCGVVLKSKSPSCGTGDARVALPGGTGRSGAAARSGSAGRAPERQDGTGLFAAGLAAALPGVPIISEAALLRPAPCDHWLTRVFAATELERLRKRDPDRRALRAFAERWREEVSAVSDEAAERWTHEASGSRNAADAGKTLDRLETLLAETLAVPPTAAGHRRVLERYARRLDLAAERSPDDPPARDGIHAAIAAFARAEAPLAAPIRALSALAAGAGDPALRDQAYLAPRPAPLGYRETIYPP